MNIVQVQWMAANLDEARRVATELVEKKLVACANLIPGVESIYIWNGKLEREQEIKVILKTRKELFPQIEDFIKRNCSYEVPAIVLAPLEQGHQPYFNWVATSTIS